MNAQQLENQTALLMQAKRGEEGAIDSLFGSYFPYVRRIVANRAGARLREALEEEDLVQESLLSASQSFDTFHGHSIAQFKSWLSRCVVHSILRAERFLRAQKRGAGKVYRFADIGTVGLHDTLFIGRDPSPSSKMRTDEQGAKVDRALFQLTEKYLEVITLRHEARMSFEDIAQEMGLQGAASARALHAKAYAKLSRFL